MKRSYLYEHTPLTLAVVALSITFAMGASRHAETASPPHASSGGHDAASSHDAAVSPRSADHDRDAADRGAHRDGNRTVVLFDDDAFWDPAWDWYGPYWYPGYPVPYASTRAYARAHRGLVPVELHVHPWKSSVIVDRNVLGQARDYNDESHPLWLKPGDHVVELQYPGYRTLRFDLDVEKGLPRDLHYRLTKGQGMDPRSQAADGSDNRDDPHPS